MMLAYFDCFAGAGGDMVVGALLDAGADAAALKEQLAKLDASGWEVSAEKVNRNGIVGTKFTVNAGPSEQPQRHLSDILAMIDAAGYPPRAAKRARDIFTRLARAEAKVHNIDVEQVHFHEVGAIDSIMDIVGSCLAMEMLAVDRVICSPLPVGKGTVRTQHGVLPVPAPATAELLVGARTVECDLQGEVLTPTAAAILTTLSESYGPMPAMEVSAVGCGAGTRTEGELPNLLRVFLGRPSREGDADTVVELSCNLDDCSGELVGAAIELLLSAGALDAWASAIVMKKSRPAYMLCALCDPCDAGKLERILFTQTTTFGVRRRLCRRSKLIRRHETVETPYGPIRIKVGRLADEEITAAPEYSDCLAAAESHHAPLREVMRVAVEAYHKSRS